MLHNMHSGVHGHLELQNSTYTLGAKDQSQSTMYDTLSLLLLICYINQKFRYGHPVVICNTLQIDAS
jgi:hypothetical protein